MILELEITNTLESQGEKWRLAVKKPTSRRGCFLSLCFSLTEDSTLKPGFLHQASTSREFHGRREANRNTDRKRLQVAGWVDKALLLLLCPALGSGVERVTWDLAMILLPY